MKSKFFLFAIILWGCNAPNTEQRKTADAPYTESKVVLKTKTGDIFGTLCLPANATGKMPVAIIIAGSGPTDRDGNDAQLGLHTNTYKELAHELSKQGIATLRYDKRGIGESKSAAKSEFTLRFEDYIRDAEGWVDTLKKDSRFSGVIIIGHSEGSLIGMIAAQNNVVKYVSVAGVGQTADKTLKEQLNAQPMNSSLKDSAFMILDKLAEGKPVAQVPMSLFMLFRPSVQGYMISWFKYDPQAEIAKLTIPVLIIQGTTDIQVGVADAMNLAKADPSAKLDTIGGMSHILKKGSADRQANAATYSDTTLHISMRVVNDIADFINKK